MAKKVIRLTEADIEKMVQKVLSEQAMNDTEVLNNLNDRIQSFMKEKQSEIFNDNLFICPVAGQDGKPILEITDKGGEPVLNKPFVNYTNFGSAVIVNKKINLGTIKLSDYYNEIIGNNNNFKKLISLHPEIKEQMDNMVISIEMVPDGRMPSFKEFRFDNSNKKVRNSRRKRFKSEGLFFGFNKKIPLKYFFDNNPMAWGTNNFFIEVDMGDISLKLGNVGLVNFGNEKTNTPEFAPENIKLDLVDVFDFDTINMKNPSGYEEVLNKFKRDLNRGLTGLKNFRDFLESQNLVVKGFASRDNDPTEQVQGKFSGCKGYGDGSRGQYNLCLSEKRAEKVAQDLQKIFDSLKVNVKIKSKGFGETSKFGPAWTKENPTKPEDTQGNRRVTFNIPKYTERN